MILSPQIITGSYLVKFDFPTDVTGDWNLTLDTLTLNKGKYTGTGTVQTSTGATSNLTATGSYSSKTGYSTIVLKGTAGSLNTVVTLSGTTMTIHSMKGTLFGQSLSYKAP